MKQITTTVALILVLSFILVSFSQMGLVNAENTIYIRADGSVEGTDKIQRDGNIYTFTGNIFDSIIVERNNIIVDGAGYTLEGMELGLALNLTTSNATIKNIHIINWDAGILGVYTNNTIMENLITGCDFGIKIYTDNYNIIGNYIGNNGEGIHIANVHQIFVSMNNITNSKFGINLLNVEDGEIVKNSIAHNERGIHNGGVYQRIYLNNFINNTVAHYSGLNFWDVVYPPGGNYYSDYNERYPNATELGNSGIWDTPYSFYVYYGPNQDNYPLMAPVDIVVIPELPSWIIMPLFMIVMLLVIVLKKKVFRKIHD